MHHGTIGVHSDGEGLGSMFYLTLPLCSQSQDDPVPSDDGAIIPLSFYNRRVVSLRQISPGSDDDIIAVSTSSTSHTPTEALTRLHLTQTLRLLIVDDSALVRKIMAMRFRKDGYDVV
jgi:hypothetical protein